MTFVSLLFIRQSTSQDTPLNSEGTAEAAYVSELPHYGAAPELHDAAWLNSSRALKLADLRGSVVLLEMWTFGCINCVRTLPYVETWHQSYAEQGLVVIGNHFPEFNYESDLNNVKASLIDLAITYPVLQDNGRETWDAYNNRYWPTMYLIDKQGNIRYKHIGEGSYHVTEQAIQDLLRETYTPPTDTQSIVVTQSLQATDVLNVRSAPGVDQTLLGAIHTDETYTVLGEQAGWYRIRYHGQDGYVSGEYVTLTP
jgi:thiol-disulfide isomerase/thioredoxin